MKMMPKFVLISLLFHWGVSAVIASNTPIPDPNNDSTDVMNRMAVEMLTKCYADHKEVVIHGDSDKLLIKTIQDTRSFTVIVAHDSSTINKIIHLRLHSSSFLMTPRSVSQLEKILLTLKTTPHWNIMDPFFILNQSKYSCRDAHAMLKAAWKVNLLKTYFLCADGYRLPSIVTYNPYTNRAPQPWKQIDKSNSGWTTYFRPYQISNICKGLDFDRTKHLDGFTITVGVHVTNTHNMFIDQSYDESLIPRLSDVMAFTVKRMKTFFNATLRFMDGSSNMLHEYTNDGLCDVSLVLSIDSDRTYPAYYESYHIIIKDQGFYTLLERIQDYGVITLLSMCMIFLITFFVIVLVGSRRRWIFAGSEILRLLINTSLYSRMDKIALKIFIPTVFLYFLVMHATFLGNLTAFLTKQEHRNHPETMEDLKDSQYNVIYVPQKLISFIRDPILIKKMISIEIDCVRDIMRQDLAVCIHARPEHLSSELKQTLHVSQRPVFELKYVYKTRKDWPLLNRFNMFLMSLESTGHSRKYILDRLEMEELERTETKISEVEAHPISIKMLVWAFIFLLIGLKLAIMSLTFEKWCRNKIPINNKRPRRGRDRQITQNIAELVEVE